MMRSQAAPLPQRHLLRCAQAYAAGNDTLGATLFALVHAEILPLVAFVAAKHVPNESAREDVIQAATLKIWQQLKRGIEPEVRRVTYHAVVDAYRTASGMGDARTLTGRENFAATNRFALIPEVDEYTDNALVDPSDDHAKTLGRVDAERYTERFAEHHDAWGLIAFCLAEGMTQNETARRLGLPRWDVNKHVADMRAFLEGESGVAV